MKLSLTVKVKNLATFSLIGKDMNNTLKLVYETFSASFKNNFQPKALPMLRVIKEISFFLHEMCCDRFKQDENYACNCNMYMFLSHIEYLLECNTLAVNRCEAAFSGIKVTEYKKTRIPLTDITKVATILALDGPFVYGQHLMILALD
ncbi:hypothetical protein T01_16262 [Trichinella spiralis]|uniref:Uncharacterized protein n=1 Tax=Trichinella spiralis TaxID=6334 RepID=A0A0V1BDC4_TRISP|nr:hypothetical protein T01_16262 [Trichinella spiralis]